MFGEERMLSALNSVKGENPEKILEGVKADVDEFVGDAPQFDDLTMVCIELIDEKDTKQ
jgi:sigma-B regulation protein RsbU (phosphoserine phosphatase)